MRPSFNAEGRCSWKNCNVRLGNRKGEKGKEKGVREYSCSISDGFRTILNDGFEVWKGLQKTERYGADSSADIDNRGISQFSPWINYLTSTYNPPSERGNGRRRMQKDRRS